MVKAKAGLSWVFFHPSCSTDLSCESGSKSLPSSCLNQPSHKIMVKNSWFKNSDETLFHLNLQININQNVLQEADFDKILWKPGRVLRDLPQFSDSWAIHVLSSPAGWAARDSERPGSMALGQPAGQIVPELGTARHSFSQNYLSSHSCNERQDFTENWMLHQN